MCRRLGLLPLVVLFVFPSLGAGLVVAVSTEPPGLDPTTNAAAVIDLLLHHNLYENLVQVDSRGGLHPQIAESWELSQDGLVYTFHLREGVRFHNGRPCDAAAVRASFMRAMAEDTAHPHPEFYREIAAIEVVDPLTVRFVLSVPDPAFLPLLALGDSVIVPADVDLSRRPVGTGPFRFEAWRPGDRLVLVRNQDYYLPGVPKLDRIVFRFIPDPSAQLAALRAGDVDLVAELTPEIAVGLEKDPAFQVVSGPQNLVQILAVNTARPPFSDLRVRQALAYAVDREEIIQLVSFGFGTPIGSHIPPGTSYYADMTWLYPHDPDRARELLKEAGYPDGFSATLTLPENYTFHVRTGEVIAAQLERVGIHVSVALVDWGTWLARVYGQADYDLTVIGHTWKLDPAPMLVGYGPDRPGYYFRRGWDDPELDRLLALGESILDEGSRKAIYTVCQYLIARDAVNIFIQDPHRILAMKAGITGVEVYPLYVLDLTAAAKE